MNISFDWLKQYVDIEGMTPQERDDLLTFSGLELVLLTIDAHTHRPGLKELCRLYEVLADYYYDKNNYQTDPNALQRYFDVFYSDKTK